MVTIDLLKILTISVGIYAIVYCAYAINSILIYRNIQLEKYKQLLLDYEKLRNKYLELVQLCDEEPLEDLTYKQMTDEIKKLRTKYLNRWRSENGIRKEY